LGVIARKIKIKHDCILEMNNCWPNPIQKLLLEASLFDGIQAVKSWNEWNTHSNSTLLDAGSLRLLPLLYLNLKQILEGDTRIEDLKQHYINTWIQNRFQLTIANEIIARLQDIGIIPLVLKGVPLIKIAYNDDLGARPMADIDVMVKPSDISTVEDELLKNGWRPTHGVPSEILRSKHSTGFENEKQICFDLHWSILHGITLSIEAEKLFWHEALKLKINKFHFTSPSLETTLFTVLIHGVEWSPNPPIRWCADAFLLIKRNQNCLNWEKVLKMAKDYHLSLSTFNALNFLRNDLFCPIPAEVLKECWQYNKKYFEITEYYVKTIKFGGIFALWFKFSRLNSSKPWFLRLSCFPHFLMQVWNLNTGFLLLQEIVKRIKGRLISY
jgi:hypothetical protein